MPRLFCMCEYSWTRRQAVRFGFAFLAAAVAVPHLLLTLCNGCRSHVRTDLLYLARAKISQR